MAILQLFRGDTIYNKQTQPGLYRGNGLTSKAFFGNSDPSYINKIGLLDTIKSHVNPVNAIDSMFYDVSTYLSFTENLDRAIYWASDKQNLLIDANEEYTETRYIFKFDVPFNDTKEVSEGIYEVKFACNKELKKSNGPDILGITTFALRHNACPICNSSDKNHSLLLIDTVKFLEKYKHLSAYDGAYYNAVEDSEWLILPNDPMQQPNMNQFMSARIQRANFWSAKHFRMPNETSRNPNLFSELGIYL